MHRVGYVLCALLLLAVAVPAFAQGPFSDVPANHWAYNAVNALAEQGLLEGYPDDLASRLIEESGVIVKQLTVCGDNDKV